MKWLRAWMPAFFWMGLIFMLSSRSKIQVSEEETINFIVFKTLHIIEYAVLFLLTYRGMKYSFASKKPILWLLMSFIVTVVYAAGDEIHQTFVPTREGHSRDVIIDGIGACISWMGIEQLYPKLPKKLRVLADKLLVV